MINTDINISVTGLFGSFYFELLETICLLLTVEKLHFLLFLLLIIFAQHTGERDVILNIWTI